MQRLTELTAKEKLRLVAALDELEDHFDLVIIDLAPASGQRAVFRGMAQEVVLVLSPEPTSLVDAYAVVKAVGNRWQVLDARVNATTRRGNAPDFSYNGRTVIVFELDFELGLPTAILDFGIAADVALFSQNIENSGTQF